jgi:alkyl hydroperoxide reductase subunit AhpF
MLDTAVSINKREDNLGRKTRYLRKGVTMCIDCDREVFKHCEI